MTGDELRQQRKAMGLTQQALANELGVDRRTVIRWEHGERKISTMVEKSFKRLRNDTGVKN